MEYDATAVRSRSLRGYIESTLDDLCLTRAENPWTSVASLRRQRPARRTVVVGDLCELVSSVDLDELAASPLSVSFLLLVRTERDRRRLAQPEVALRLNDDRFFVFDMKCLKPPDLHQAMHGYLEGLVERLAPDRLRSARFSQLDCVLWLEFGDGLARAADWSSLPLARRLSFTPVAASAREHGQSLLLVDADGHPLDEKMLYEAALTVMMRLVFLFNAEERDLLNAPGDAYQESYAVTPLGARLRILPFALGVGIIAYDPKPHDKADKKEKPAKKEHEKEQAK